MADAWSVAVRIDPDDPEWDDVNRGRAEGLHQFDADVHACGLHQSILDDPDHHKFRFDDTTCEMCAAIDQHQRALEAADAEWEEKHPHAKPGQRRPSDGRSTRLREVSPAEQLLDRARSAAAE